MTSEPLTQNIQDYLKTIYEIASADGSASTTALAARLGISPASVTGMLQKLSTLNPPLVVYKKHQGVTLTPEGERAALEVIRHHRLLETYLVQTLGYSWADVHEEACRLEHVISEDFEAKIAELLGHPAHDPHGDPIPDAQLNLPGDANIPLSSLREGQKATIRRVRSDEPAFLRHVEQLGLIPGASVSVLAYSPFDQNLEMRVEGQMSKVIGPAISSQIYVELQP